MIKKTNPRLKKFSWLLLLPLFLACNLLPNNPDPTPIPEEVPVMLSPSSMPPATAEPTESPTLTPTVEAAQTPTPEPVSSGPALLPAALYFLNTSGQIMRLEADAHTLRQITAEPDPILDFDISPTDSRIIYISGNNLIETDSEGNNGIVKVTGQPFDENNPEDYITKNITAPRFSPDGTQIAFGLNGINTIPVGDATEYQVILPSDPYPNLSDLGANNGNSIRFYGSAEWSPDGTKLLVNYSHFPEGSSLAIRDLTTGSLTDLANPDSDISCCNWVWAADSQTGYVASDMIAFGAPGLVHFDAVSGLGTTIVNGLPPTNVEPNPDNPIRLFKSAFPTEDSSLLSFIATFNSYDEFGSVGLYSMYRVAPDGSQISPLRILDSYPIWDVLWADDGRGAIIVDSLFNQRFPPTGPMHWLTADEGSPLSLPANGSHPRWGEGPSGPIQSGEPTEADFSNLDSQVLSHFGIQLAEDGIDGLYHGRFNLGDGRSLWFVHTTGLRNFNDQQHHTVAIYAFENGSWRQLAINILPDFDDTNGIPGPDYMAARSVQQIYIEPDGGWLSVEGGIGAHGGTMHILRFDGESLTVEAENSNGSPVAGRVEDINGDGRQEVLLDLTDYYIFSYAAGVRLINYQVLRWNGTELVPAVLTRLENTSPATALNNEAINFTEAQLWPNAQAVIARAIEQAPQDETINWNAAIINTIAEARQNANSSYPIMDWVFYGDYEAVINNMRGFTPADIFSSESPLIIGTSAEGSENLMAEQIEAFTTSALTLQPDYAAAHFLRGWAAYLQNPNDPAVLAEIQQAATLAPDDDFYANALSHLQP